MGLIKAAINAVAGNLADQYKEYIYCESLSNDILAAKGHKRVGSRGTNKGDDNVITDGSAIAVNEVSARLWLLTARFLKLRQRQACLNSNPLFLPPCSPEALATVL